MTRKQRLLLWGAAVAAAGAISLSIAARSPELATEAQPSRAPLMMRAFTDAGSGQVTLFGIGSDIVLELRVTEGQAVKRGEVVAVLANFPQADGAVRSAEAELKKTQARRDSLAAGILVAKEQPSGANGPDAIDKPKPKAAAAKPGIAEQEVLVKLSAEEAKLKAVTMQRSGLPPDQRELEVNVSQQAEQHEEARLRVLKQTLADDLAEADIDVNVRKASVENARMLREQALVRSPIDGVVVRILAHPGERIQRGLMQIVDMSKLRVVADIDEVLLGRMKVGGKVLVTFRGDKESHSGRIVLIGSEVRRTPNMGNLGSDTTSIRSVSVKIELDDPAAMPKMIGREATVVFEENS